MRVMGGLPGVHRRISRRKRSELLQEHAQGGLVEREMGMRGVELLVQAAGSDSVGVVGNICQKQ